ncbi:hypothetical protein SO3561_09999 [Streptomyces olivochromogenes]|uniref:Uncharacterized protein n=1 Tax=Streptomyces olivochromogenes TaxID=1963 RepID=A0A250VWF4_STROL|nr:hypothetical protein SO3561_09999 [Streptomyces olivochromogenes]
MTSIRQRLPLGDRPGGSPLLAELTAQPREITHKALDALPRTSPTRHLPVTRIADPTTHRFHHDNKVLKMTSDLLPRSAQ